MKIKIDNEQWEIDRLPSEEMLKRYYELNSEKTPFVFGLCDYRFHKIHINSDCCFDQQVTTLKHELTHLWIFTRGIYFSEINEEIVCDIVARSNDFIYNITEKFINTYRNGV